MRKFIALAAFAILASSLSACAVYDAGSAVVGAGATIVTATADVATSTVCTIACSDDDR